MDISIIWKSIILILVGMGLLRISGRKAISQMTVAQIIIFISLGTILVQPIVKKNMTGTIAAAIIFVLLPFVFEYLQLKFNSFEKLITGKSEIIIENGTLNVQNLKKLRLTVDQLEMRLREKGISKFEDLKFATIESNGLLGYELKDELKPLTTGDFKKFLEVYQLSLQSSSFEPNPADHTIFKEIKNPDGQNNPEYLQ